MQTKLESECPHQNEWDLCHGLLFQSKLLECNWWVWNWGGEGFGSIFRNLPALPNPQYAVLPLIRHPANPSGGLFAVWGTRSEVLIIGVLSTKVQSPPRITLYEVLIYKTYRVSQKKRTFRMLLELSRAASGKVTLARFLDKVTLPEAALLSFNSILKVRFFFGNPVV